MPYKLQKKPKHNLFWVVNKRTGEKYSKEPLPKSRAEAQMRALYASERMTGGNVISVEHPMVQDAIAEAMKDIKINLIQQVNAQQQIEQSKLSGGYQGSDDLYDGKSIARYVEPTADVAFLDLLKEIGQGLVKFFNFIKEGLGTIPVVGGFLSAVAGLLASPLEVVGYTLQGNLHEAIIALDTIAKELPVIGIIRNVGSIINELAHGRNPADALKELGESVITTVESVATAGASTVLGKLASTAIADFQVIGFKGAVKGSLGSGNVIRESIKSGIYAGIATSIKQKMMSPDLAEKVMGIVLKNELETNPELPAYSFESPITGNVVNVLLEAIADYPPDGQSILAQRDDSIFNSKALANAYGYPVPGGDLTKLPLDLRKQFFHDDTDPQREQIIRQLTAEDRALLSTNKLEQIQTAFATDFYNLPYISEVIKNLANGVKYPVDADDRRVVDYIDVPKLLDINTTPYPDELREISRISSREQFSGINNEIAQVGRAVTDYGFLGNQYNYGATPITKKFNYPSAFQETMFNTLETTDDMTALRNFLREINIGIQGQIDIFNQSNEDFRLQILSNFQSVNAELVEQVLEGVLQEISDAGGSITREQYDLFKTAGEQSLNANIETVANPMIQEAIDNQEKEDGTALSEEQISILMDDISTALSEQLEETVFNAINGLAYDSQYTKRQEDLDDVNQQIDELLSKLRVYIDSVGAKNIDYSNPPMVSSLPSGTANDDLMQRGRYTDTWKELQSLFNKRTSLMNASLEAFTNTNPTLANELAVPELINQFKTSFEINRQQQVNRLRYELGEELKISTDVGTGKITYGSAYPKFLKSPEGIAIAKKLKQQNTAILKKPLPPSPGAPPQSPDTKPRVPFVPPSLPSEYKTRIFNLIEAWIDTDAELSSTRRMLQSQGRYATDNFVKLYADAMIKKSDSSLGDLLPVLQTYQDEYSKAYIAWTKIFSDRYVNYSAEFKEYDKLAQVYNTAVKEKEEASSGINLQMQKAFATSEFYKNYVEDAVDILLENLQEEEDEGIQKLEENPGKYTVNTFTVDDLKRSLGLLPPLPPPPPKTIPPPALQKKKPVSVPIPTLNKTPPTDTITPALQKKPQQTSAVVSTIAPPLSTKTKPVAVPSLPPPTQVQTTITPALQKTPPQSVSTSLTITPPPAIQEASILTTTAPAQNPDFVKAMEEITKYQTQRQAELGANPVFPERIPTVVQTMNRMFPAVSNSTTFNRQDGRRVATRFGRK